MSPRSMSSCAVPNTKTQIPPTCTCARVCTCHTHTLAQMIPLHPSSFTQPQTPSSRRNMPQLHSYKHSQPTPNTRTHFNSHTHIWTAHRNKPQRTHAHTHTWQQPPDKLGLEACQPLCAHHAYPDHQLHMTVKNNKSNRRNRTSHSPLPSISPTGVAA